MKKLAVERPVGTPANETVNALLESEFRALGLRVDSLPLDCDVWKGGAAELVCGENTVELNVSPYSRACVVKAVLDATSTIDELQNTDCSGKILLLTGELCREQLQPKDYPFYFPDEHRDLIALLERKAPAAIVAVTGKSEMCGMEPFNLFNDGNFLIPSAYTDAAHYESLRGYVGNAVSLTIESSIYPAQSRQLIAKTDASDGKKLVICAHMDSQYNTPAALDNAAGVASLMHAAKLLAGSGLNIEFVPFNGEEYYRASGELAYLDYLIKSGQPSLVVNIDSPCHAGSDVAVCLFNFDDAAMSDAQAVVSAASRVGFGAEWYSGDHAMFAFSGIPCAAVSSSDIFTGGLCDTHTPRDTTDTVDTELIQAAGDFAAKLLHSFAG